MFNSLANVKVTHLCDNVQLIVKLTLKETLHLPNEGTVAVPLDSSLSPASHNYLCMLPTGSSLQEVTLDNPWWYMMLELDNIIAPLMWQCSGLVISQRSEHCHIGEITQNTKMGTRWESTGKVGISCLFLNKEHHRIFFMDIKQYKIQYFLKLTPFWHCRTIVL